MTEPSFSYPTYTVRTDVSGSRAAIVSPFAAEYTGTTTAAIGVTDITQQVYFTNIDNVFEDILSEEEAVRFLNAFRIQDTNVNIDLPSGGTENFHPTAVGPDSPNYALVTSQSSPMFNVDLTDTTNFQDVLYTSMVRATDPQYVETIDITEYMRNEVRLALNRQLQDSGLIDMLEATNVQNVEIVLQFANGASDMTQKMSELDASGSYVLSDKRRQLLTQIPLSTLDHYIFETQKLIHYLPLKGGDSITFVFDVGVNTDAILTAIPYNVYDGNPNPYVNFVNVQSSVNFAPVNRRVAFVLHMTDKQTYFCRNYNAVSIPSDVPILSLEDAIRVVRENAHYLTAYAETYMNAYTDVPNPSNREQYIQKAQFQLASADAAARQGASSYSGTVTSITEQTP
jgi:hypothetical protein